MNHFSKKSRGGNSKYNKQSLRSAVTVFFAICTATYLTGCHYEPAINLNNMPNNNAIAIAQEHIADSEKQNIPEELFTSEITVQTEETLTHVITSQVKEQLPVEVTVEAKLQASIVDIDNYENKKTKKDIPAYIPVNSEISTLCEYINSYLVKYPSQKVNLSELHKKNSDMAGFLRMPVLGIEEPIVMSKYEDYNYYLEHDINHKKDLAGCIEVDYKNAGGIMYGRNNILYGHNMANGSKFGKLKDLLNSSTQNKLGSDFIEIMNIDTSGDLFKIVSIFITDENDLFYNTVYRDLKKTDSYNYFRENIKQRNIVPKFNDEGIESPNFITLSTCYGISDNGKRLVVVAQQVGTISAKE
jgi:sortase B